MPKVQTRETFIALRATRTAHRVASDLLHPRLTVTPEAEVAPPLEVMDRTQLPLSAFERRRAARRMRVLLVILLALLMLDIAVWTTSS